MCFCWFNAKYTLTHWFPFGWMGRHTDHKKVQHQSTAQHIHTLLLLSYRQRMRTIVVFWIHCSANESSSVYYYSIFNSMLNISIFSLWLLLFYCCMGKHSYLSETLFHSFGYMNKCVFLWFRDPDECVIDALLHCVYCTFLRLNAIGVRCNH